MGHMWSFRFKGISVTYGVATFLDAIAKIKCNVVKRYIHFVDGAFSLKMSIF